MFRIHARQERTALVSWGLAVFVYFLLIGLSYAAVKDNAEYDKLWEEFPDAMKEAFGGTDSITSVDGYVHSQATSYLPVLLGIYAIAAATKRTAGAEETGLLDHLLARPVGRSAYLGSLAMLLTLNTLIIIAAAALGTLIGMAASGVGGADLLRLVALLIDIIPLALAFAAIGVLLGAWMHRRAPALGIGLLVVIGSFAFQIVASVVDGLAWTEWINPFGLWGRSDGFHGELEPVYYIASVAVIVAAGALARWRFVTKDLYA